MVTRPGLPGPGDDTGSAGRDQALAVYTAVMDRCGALVRALQQQVLLVVEGPAAWSSDAAYRDRVRECEQQVARLRLDYERALDGVDRAPRPAPRRTTRGPSGTGTPGRRT